jgi:hypothetical protein
MSARVLLGPQDSEPRLGAWLDALALSGPVCVVSAGWQEREGELDELRRQIDCPLSDLALYARAFEIFSRDQRLFDAHRRRQSRLIALQRYYRIRLSRAMDAARALFAMDDDGDMLQTERRAAILALRSLDRHHIRQLRKVHEDFLASVPLEREPAVVRQRARIENEVARCAAVLVAGGHVAILVNRMRLFGLDELLADKPVLAWSGGAMVLSDRIVLFHDHPPQGASDPEVLEAGLGLVPGVVALPRARERLSLGDTKRVALLARRFGPARCAVLESGSALHWGGRSFLGASRVSQLTRDGAVEAFAIP